MFVCCCSNDPLKLDNRIEYVFSINILIYQFNKNPNDCASGDVNISNLYKKKIKNFPLSELRNCANFTRFLVCLKN